MSDKHWSFEQHTEQPVIEGKFDPIALGFTEYIPSRFSGRKALQDKDYIAQKKNGAGGKAVRISLCEDTANFVLSFLGKSVNVYTNEKGQTLLVPGRLSNLVTSGGSRARKTINVNGLRERFDVIFGDYRRIYLTAKPYAKGEALLLIPNGERE